MYDSLEAVCDALIDESFTPAEVEALEQVASHTDDDYGLFASFVDTCLEVARDEAERGHYQHAVAVLELTDAVPGDPFDKLFWEPAETRHLVATARLCPANLGALWEELTAAESYWRERYRE